MLWPRRLKPAPAHPTIRLQTAPLAQRLVAWHNGAYNTDVGRPGTTMARSGPDWLVTAAYAVVALLLLGGAVVSFVQLF